MGNNKSAPVVEKALKEEVTSTCTVCFDECVDTLRCDRGHALCSTCVAPYIQSIVEDAGKLKDQRFVIRCPAEKCKSAPYCPAELYQYCNPKGAMNQYVNTLVEICNHSSFGVNQSLETKCLVVPRLLEALNLRCPNASCAAVLDPTPDGCAAVRCASCATYTCFLCFCTCADSFSCHKHVRECAHSPAPSNLFISEALRQPAHKRVRVMQLRDVLAKELITSYVASTVPPHTLAGSQQSNKLGEQLARMPMARHHLKSLGGNLKDMDILPEDVFELDVTNKAHAAVQMPGVGNRYAGGRAAGPGPLLQPAVGRYVQCWEVLAVLVMVLLFLCAMVYVVFLLASIANRRKGEGGSIADAVFEDPGDILFQTAADWAGTGAFSGNSGRAESIALSGLPFEDAKSDGMSVTMVITGAIYATVVIGLICCVGAG